jgi:hypothetical protein
VRLPGGRRLGPVALRCGDGDALQALFAWLDCAEGVLGGCVEGSKGDYALAAQFPRIVLRRPAAAGGGGLRALAEGGSLTLSLEPLAEG